eukprot:1525190-Rhodomonas_salina.1
MNQRPSLVWVMERLGSEMGSELGSRKGQNERRSIRHASGIGIPREVGFGGRMCASSTRLSSVVLWFKSFSLELGDPSGWSSGFGFANLFERAAVGCRMLESVVEVPIRRVQRQRVG